MKRVTFVLLVALPCLTFAAGDGRQFVEMPPDARAELRAEMLDFQSAFQQIIAALAEGKSSDAGTIAEKNIGVSAMGRHRTAPANARPGRYMPPEMHAMARTMHQSASEFANTAQAGDASATLKALAQLSGTCVGCHRTYRTQ